MRMIQVVRIGKSGSGNELLRFIFTVVRKSLRKARNMIPWPRLFKGHSLPQSLRSFWPAAGIESSGSNHFEITKEITECCPSRLTKSSSMAHAWNGCSQSLSIPAAGQKDRRLWGRECPRSRILVKAVVFYCENPGARAPPITLSEMAYLV